jgi:hypothetical protein
MALQPSYDRGKILTGVAAMYVQEYDAGSPAALPADTVALGSTSSWEALGWLPVGATQEGVTVGFTREVQDIMIEEQVTQVDQRTTSVAFTFTVTLSEDSIQSMMWAYGGGDITTTAAASGIPGKQELKISSEVRHFSIGFEAENSFKKARRLLVPDVTSVAEVETAYRRAEEQRMYACTFTSLVPPEDVEIVEITADALP